jgi:hypothetical protein
VAGVKGKSGGANGGPQYNPANISATGGDGQSGKQPVRYIPDMKSLRSTGVETMAQQNAAPLAATQSPKMTGADMYAGMNLPTLLDETKRRDEPTSAGVDFGAGPGSEVLPPSLGQDQRPIENKAIIEKYLPAMMEAGRSVDAPDSYKQFLSYLLKKMQ